MSSRGGTTRWSESGRPDAGQTTLEYAVIVAMIAVGVVAAVIFLGTRVSNRYSDAGASAPMRPPVAQCDPNYSGACVPAYPPDIDCSDLRRQGIRRVAIIGSDPHGLDPDGDGIGCN